MVVVVVEAEAAPAPTRNQYDPLQVNITSTKRRKMMKRAVVGYSTWMMMIRPL